MKKEIILAIGVGAILLIAGALMVRRQVKNQVYSYSIAPTVTPIVTPKPKMSGLTLAVSTPSNGVLIKTNKTIVMGKTVPNAEVLVNEIEVKADAKGNFSATLTLDEGENTILVFANDADGNYAEKQLTVVSETY